MSKYIEIEDAIESLGPGEYQRLCSAYIIKKRNFSDMHDIGSKEGTNKTTIGIPDSYSVDENKKYTLFMYGTVKKKSIAKLKKDINDACNESKTGITKEQINEIICFHTNTNITPGEHKKLVNSIPNVKITLIDIDSMAHDIDENYHIIAKDYLNISIDTNQISDINTFVERYDKSSVNSPLNIDFVYRKDTSQIYESIINSKMTIISGKSGNGKTKTSLEVLKDLEKNEKYIPLCVRINGLDLYEDIKTSIKSEKKYIIFIDDINNLNGIQSVIDLIITNKNENIKILATVRDYLLDEVLKKIGSYVDPNVYYLNEMTDTEIIEILENTYNVKNKEWQKKILKISNGNPKLAIMSFIAVRDGKINSLNSVYDVFKNYYESIFEQKKLSKKEIDILFYISILSPISTSNEYVKNVFYELCIFDVNEFKKLRDMELIDYFNDDALKTCDQNFANYLIYKYLIVDKLINISDLLKKMYPNFINKFVNIVNMINNQFYNKETIDYIATEINSVWKEKTYDSDWNFVKYFHNIDVQKALLKIKNRIQNFKTEEIPKEIAYNSNPYLHDDLLNLLSDFKDTEYYKLSFELLLLYLEKKPNKYNEICKSIKDYWLMKNPNLGFDLETEIINILLSKYTKSSSIKMKQIYKILLVQSLLYCLELEFHISEQGKNLKTINLITLKLQKTEKLITFRRYIYDIMFQLCCQDESDYNLFLNEGIWFYDDTQKSIFMCDIKYLDEKFFINWNKVSIIQSKILFNLEKLCYKFEIDCPKSLTKYKKNSEFLLLSIFEKYDYDTANDELIHYLKNKDVKCYTMIFKMLRQVEVKNIKVDKYKITNSLDILFKYIIENDISLLKDVFNLYLKFDCPFSNRLFFLKSVADKEVIKMVINDIINSSTSKKYYLLTCILNDFCDEEYLPIVKNFIKNQNTINKYTLSIETIFKYSKYDNKLLEEYTKEIISQNNLGLYSNYTSSFADTDFIEDLFSFFNNKSIIEELYLKSIKNSSDYEGILGYMLCINNYDMIDKILKSESYDHENVVISIFEKLWLYPKYDEIITYAYNKLVGIDLGYLRLNLLFVNEDNKNVKNNQVKWFKNKIIEYKEDKEKIHDLFYAICEKENDLRKELILFLLDNTDDFEIFKCISLFPSSESWSGSRIPNIEQKIEFLESILNELKIKDNVEYIEHIEYLNEMINSYKEKIRSVQIKEYVDDFLN